MLQPNTPYTPFGLRVLLSLHVGIASFFLSFCPALKQKSAKKKAPKKKGAEKQALRPERLENTSYIA